MSISTHVLDTATGRPAAGLPVTLEQRRSAGWLVVCRNVTDTDGRVAALLDATEPGTYRITFDIDTYTHGAGFYPVISVVFRATDDGGHYHIPVLLSPFGYSTYRGS